MVTTTLEIILLLLLFGGIIHVVSLLRKRALTNRLLKEAKEKNQQLIEELPELYSRNQNLSEINEYYRDLVEVANDLIFRCDINGYFLFSNTKAFTVWGLDEKELLGRKYLDYIREDYRRTAEKFFFRQFISRELTSYFEYPAIGLNKEVIWLGQNTQLIFEDDEPIGFQAVARDITELKKTQALLQESEKQYRNVVDILQEGIVIQDKDGKIITANASAEKILGLSLEQMKGLTSLDPMWRTIHEDGSDFASEKHPSVVSLRTGKPLSGVIIGVYCSNHDLIWVSVNSQPIFKNDNPTPEGVVITFSDITKRKKAEQDLLQSNQNINAWMNSTKDAIWSVDTNQIILACNNHFKDIYRKFNSIEIQKGDSFIANLNPVMKDAMSSFHSRALTGEAFTVEYPAVSIDGETTLFEISFNPIYDGDKITGVASLAIDFTERIHQQEEIRRSKANLDAWINSSKDAIWSTDTNYHILACNNHFKKMFKKYSGNDIDKGDHFIEKMTWGSQDNIIALTFLYERALSGESFTIEYPAIYDDEILFFEIVFNPIYEEEKITGVASFARDITEFKNQNEEIRHSRANLDAWMNNTKDAIWAVDRELNLILMNKSSSQGYKDLTGYDLELGSSALNLIHPDLAEYWTNLYNRAFAGESFVDEQSYFINNTNSYVDMSLSPIYEGDAVIGVAVLSIDVTQRKNTEQALKQTMLLQKAILDSSNYMIIATKIDGTISTFNPAAERALGYGADELIGKQTPGVFHLPSEVVERAAMLSVELGFEVPVGFETFVAKAKIGQFYEDEWTYVRKDGTHFPVLLSISPLQSSEGEITGYLGIATDITVQKQTLFELEKRDVLLEGTSNALRYLITAKNFENGVKDALTIIGQSANVDRIYFCKSSVSEDNAPAMQLLVEWSKQSIDLPEVEYNAVRYIDIGLNRWHDVLSGGSIIQGARSSFPDGEREIIEKAGIHSLIVIPIILRESLWGFLGVYDYHTERIWEEWERAALQSVASSLAGAIERDNTQENLKIQAHDLEIKNHELTLARESAEVANRSKSTFLSNMSHELRTPLNAILGFAQILQKDKTLIEQNRNYISMMYRSGNHLLDMINDVLDISKIEAGHMELVLEEFDLHELFTEIGEMFILRCKEKKLDFHIDAINLDLRFVVADHKRLKQVLINLISNAVKFTSKGSVTVSIIEKKRIVAKKNSESDEIAYVEFSVTDTGRGIPTEQIRTIFQPFKQVSGMYSDGTGLGLAICDRIIRMMEGEITIQSTIGKGSIFSFEIPLQLRQEALVIKSPTAKPIIGIKSDRKWKVLIVDDIATNCIVARGLLEPLGFICAEADTGKSALERINEFQPDIVLMDILMPDMCGDEAVKILRTMPEYAALPVIALTASGFDGRRDELISIGFNEYIRKPFLENELYKMIEQFIPVEFIREDTDSEASELDNQLNPTEIAEQIWNLPEGLRKELSEAIEFQDFENIERLLVLLPDTPAYFQVNIELQKAITLSNYKLLMAITNNLETYS